MITLFGLTQCSTCVKARRWLDDNSLPHQFIDYRAQPIAPTLLKQWAEQLGGWEKLVNRASMTWRNLDDAKKTPSSDADWLALIAEFPALIRRPVALTEDGIVGVAFNEKRYAERFLAA